LKIDDATTGFVDNKSAAKMKMRRFFDVSRKCGSVMFPRPQKMWARHIITPPENVEAW
jgi:hypothetical protein